MRNALASEYACVGRFLNLRSGLCANCVLIQLYTCLYICTRYIKIHIIQMNALMSWTDTQHIHAGARHSRTHAYELAFSLHTYILCVSLFIYILLHILYEDFCADTFTLVTYLSMSLNIHTYLFKRVHVCFCL